MFTTDAVSTRKNSTQIWCPMDTERNYRSIQPNGDTNYLPTDISYKFNSCGFRCDEFTDEADIRILFMGCSFTEGIGLPLEDIWTTLFLNKIKSLPQNIGKKIPYWTIAAGGTGIDFTARVLCNYIDTIKPTHIIYMMGSTHRREYCLNSLTLSYWIPMPNKYNAKIVDPLFADEFYSYHQSIRSAQLINFAANTSQSKVYVFDISADDDDYLGGKIFEPFQNITYNRINPNDYTDIPLEFAYIMNKPRSARDSSHPGALWQYSAYMRIWGVVKGEFNPK